MNPFFTGKEILECPINPGVVHTENGKTYLRGMIGHGQDNTNDPRINGELTIETNAYIDTANGWELLWGTSVMENPRGKWLAAWVGQKTARCTTIYAMGYGGLWQIGPTASLPRISRPTSHPGFHRQNTLSDLQVHYACWSGRKL